MDLRSHSDIHRNQYHRESIELALCAIFSPQEHVAMHSTGCTCSRGSAATGKDEVTAALSHKQLHVHIPQPAFFYIYVRGAPYTSQFRAVSFSQQQLPLQLPSLPRYAEPRCCQNACEHGHPRGSNRPGVAARHCSGGRQEGGRGWGDSGQPLDARPILGRAELLHTTDTSENRGIF